MKHIFSLIAILFLVTSWGQKQPLAAQSLLPNWERYFISNVGYIDIPSYMEIPSGSYEQIMNAYFNRLEIDAPQLMFQQKGLNDFNSEAFTKYGRIIVETQLGNYGDFLALSYNIATVTSAEISELNLNFKAKTINDLQSIGHELIEWYPLRVQKINGMPCIHVSYRRQLGSNPIVLVNYFVFQNTDRVHTLTLSYRVSESAAWKTDFARIQSSFRITNIK
jgi:hypothetical protein